MDQKGRVYAIDLARGLAVLFMIWVHVLITYSTPEVVASPFGLVIGFLGSPAAAPVFMTLMGVSFCYSRHKELWPSVKRGLYIFLAGYLLNFFKGVLPVFLVNLFLPSAAAGIPDAVANYKDAFLEIDILQFAGIALIVMALIRAFKLNRYIILLLAIVIMFFSPFLWGMSTGIPVIDHIIDLFCGNKPSVEKCIGNLVSFPFFPWFIFPLVGIYLGEILTQTSDTNRIFRISGLAGVILLIISGIIIMPNLSYHINDYYHCRPAFVVFIIGFVLAWVWLCSIIVEKIKVNKVFEILFLWSKNVTNIYFIQWILIMAGADAVFGFNKCSYLRTIMVIIVIMFLTHYIDKAYSIIKTKTH